MPEQPAQPLTLTDAIRAAAGADGYLTAATQSAFLQAYGGVGVAAEAANARAPPCPHSAGATLDVVAERRHHARPQHQTVLREALLRERHPSLGWTEAG